MWVLDNRTPYAAERNWTRDTRGRHRWIVAVRATFDLDEYGSLRLADEQPPPALAPAYHGEPGTSSLRWDSDLLRVRTCTDVIAEAHAHAPMGRARPSLPVRLRVGPIDKQLVVFGPRQYQRGAAGVVLGAPQPFVSQAISYEGAFGGTDASDPDPLKHVRDERNPLGRGFALDRKRLVGSLAPSIEYAKGNLAEVGPAGFGAIDPAWLPRRKYAGTYDATWEKEKRPLLPDDYDDLFASAAPSDQRVADHLYGGETVELSGLTPTGGLRFELPKVYLTYTTFFGARRAHHRGKLITVLLQPELGKVSLVWQSSLLVNAAEIDYLDETRIGEKAYVR
jgi:hypothetical protein